ncbi:MAG: alkylhydroperoxidase [Rhizobiales bacterium PAR1]|nr:MAG: alkylhydroperoxidase [Rhizobiales bacterium PAR1]
MMKDYLDITRSTSAGLRELRKDVPEPLAGFSQLTREAMKDGVLDKKTKEFIAMALGVAARCDACLGFHAEALVKLGATRQELAEVLAVAVQMGGGPSLMTAADAMSAFLQFEAQKPT